MTAAEEGVLLLCSRLGDHECKPLTMPQFRELGLRVRAAAPEGDPLRQLTTRDLTALDYDPEQADRIIRLLDRENRLRQYLQQGEQQGIFPLTRLSAVYPARFRQQLGLSCPPVLFYKGDPARLEQPTLAVIGSRKLHPENEVFARQAGRIAAESKRVLISGGAEGADSAAQTACLAAGGSCVIFVPDRLDRYAPQEHILYISTDGYDLPFSPQRALARNSLIHIQGDRVIAAQCSHGTGGTWQGCTENLKHGWSDLFVFDDGSAAMTALMELGATGIRQLQSINDLKKAQLSLF